MKYLGLPLGAPFKEKLNWDPILECAEVGWIGKDFICVADNKPY